VEGRAVTCSVAVEDVLPDESLVVEDCPFHGLHEPDSRISYAARGGCSASSS
jgi:hypothetical protein